MSREKQILDKAETGSGRKWETPGGRASTQGKAVGREVESLLQKDRNNTDTPSGRGATLSLSLSGG